MGILKFGERLGHGGTTVGNGHNPYYLPSAQATMEVMVNALTLDAPSEAEVLRIFGTLAEHFYPGTWPQPSSPPPENGD